jgi:hypothetical protein
MFRKYFILCVLLALWQQINAQCLPAFQSFKVGEKITYQAYYNWGFIWVHAGDIEFSVKSKVYLSKQSYYFEASGNSLKSYDWIYKVRDRFQSLVDMETFQPLWFERNTYEGGYKAYEKYSFVPGRNKVFSAIENSKQPYFTDTLHVKPCTLDVLTAIYYCRNLNFDKYKVQERIPINTLIDNSQYALYIRYLGKENVKLRDGRQFRCIKFSALLVEGTIFKGGEDMFIWVTDDENRIPVLVEAKILVGSVKAYLNTAEGIKGELKAWLNKK